jgi:hypothetical protein
MIRNVACKRKGKCMYKLSVTKHGRNKLLGKPIRRRKDNIKMDVKKIKDGNVWIGFM